MSLNRNQLLQLARHGASARLAELRAEIATIEQTFPDLKRGRSQRSIRKGQTGSEPASTADERQESTPKRRGWTPAQRKAAAARMKAYWRKRKNS